MEMPAVAMLPFLSSEFAVVNGSEEMPPVKPRLALETRLRYHRPSGCFSAADYLTSVGSKSHLNHTNCRLFRLLPVKPFPIFLISSDALIVISV